MLPLVSGAAVAQGGIRVENITWVAAPRFLSTSDEQPCERLRDTLASLPKFPRQTVRLGSGAFYCGEKPLVVPDHVVLEGSGRGARSGTEIVGQIENSVWGVVHLEGQATLSRLTVSNYGPGGPDGSVGVSAFDTATSHHGSPKLIDVTVQVFFANPAYPLVVIGKDVEARGAEFRSGAIRLLGGGYTFTLFGGALRIVDADETVTARCYFYRSLLSDAAVAGPACP